MLLFRVASSFFCSTHWHHSSWLRDHSARTHLAYAVCRLLSHVRLKTRISCSSLTGSVSWRLAASLAQARPRFEWSTTCATLSGAVQRKQAIDHMSAHIRMQQSPSRCNALLRRSHSSPDRWPSPSPVLDPSAHSGGKSPYHGLITVPSIGPPFSCPSRRRHPSPGRSTAEGLRYLFPVPLLPSV